jgi:Methylamine utilization protein MauJ
MRYEVAVETHLVFHTQAPARPIWELAAEPETVVIEFEGRRFVWHANERDADGTEYWPTVTTMVANPDDYWPERVAVQRFLSALVYRTRISIEVIGAIGAGPPGERDPAHLRQPRRGVGAFMHSAPAEVVMVNDDRLRTTLAHFREGLTTSSPFFRFLGFWNALDVACEDYPGRLPAWIPDPAERLWFRRGPDPPPADIWEYLRTSSRNAIAHAIPRPPVLALDPDEPEDRRRLGADATLLEVLAEERIHERWGSYAVYFRPQRR